MEKDEWLVLKDEGHSFEMLEESEFIEIKNGPYLKKEDKIRFNEK